MTASSSSKITRQHHERDAYVYVRQSSPQQVLHNLESQRNQYALVQRAIALGWPAAQVHVIDSDLGQSGQDSLRAGFRELVAAVSLGRVGLVLAYEASRLARNNGDWYSLLDLATVQGTLIADADGVYDPREYNDRLLLGLRGMLSEAELHLLRLRLDAGRLRQVERGVYRQHLPTGLERLADGQVVKDADLQVQRTLLLVFERFTQLGSCQKVMRSFRDEGLLLPRRQHSGLDRGCVIWKRASDAALYDILRNPAYAGAFVYGRHAPHPVQRGGRRTRVINRAPADWRAVHYDVYPAYISWEQYLANQARLTDNANRYNLRTRGAPRSGAALLAGLVVCGRCGRQMLLTYKPQLRYFCAAANRAYGERSCLHLDGASIDAAVVDAFFAALAPAELALLDDVLAAQQAEQASRQQQYADQLTRAEYEAKLAQRQYQAVDPDNRLVAAELERRWELALRAVSEARTAAETFTAQPPSATLDPDLRELLADVSRHLPALWGSERLQPPQKKELLRSLIRRVILTRPVPDTVGVKIVWVSGAYTPLTVHPPIHRAVDVSDHAALVQRIVALSAEGYQDAAITQRLIAEGFHSARSRSIPRGLVGNVRRAQGQASLTERFRAQPQIEGQWTVWGLSRLLQVSRNWLYDRITDGELPAARHPLTGHYLIPDEPGLVKRLRAQVPARRHV